jgi:hypothetical protein
MDDQQNTNPTPSQPELNTQPQADPPQRKEKFKLYYVQDSVVSQLTVGRARGSEIFFIFIAVISVLTIRGTLNPHNYKHYDAVVSYAYVLTGAILSFIIFFVLMSAFMRKRAGKVVSPTHRRLPGGLFVGASAANIAIAVNHSLISNLSGDNNTHAVGAIAGFMGVMCISFAIVMHDVVKKIHSYPDTQD